MMEVIRVLARIQPTRQQQLLYHCVQCPHFRTDEKNTGQELDYVFIFSLVI
jgi:hypothetical protein